MATVVDALFVTLGLDAKGFTQGRRQVSEDLRRTTQEANAAAKAIEASGKQAALFFHRLRNEAIALFATFTASRSVVDFMKDITASDAATGRLARNLGISTQALSAWEKAAESVGGTAGGTASSLQGIVQGLQQWAATGESSILPWLNALGISIADVNTGKMRSVTDILLDLNKALYAKAQQDPRTAQLFANNLGIDAGTLQLLEMAPDALRKLLAEKAAIAPNDKSAKISQDIWRDIKSISDRIEDLGRAIRDAVGPEFDKLLQKMDAWLKEFGPRIKTEITDKIGELVKAIESIDWAAQWKGFIDALSAVRDILQQIQHMFTALTPPGWLRDFLAWKPPPWLDRLMRPGTGPDGEPGPTTREGGYTGESQFDRLIEALKRQLWMNHSDSPSSQGGPSGDGDGTLGNWIMSAIGMGMHAREAPLGTAGGLATPASYTVPAPSTGATAPLSGLDTPLGALGRSSDARAAGIRDQLMRDLGLTRDQAAGIVSNLQAESGLQGINERHPAVPGSRGGFGWAQWTGPRRVAFEAWAAAHGLDPRSDAANYGFLVHELRTQYGGTLQGVRGSRSAREAAARFFRGYESGGAAGLERWLSAHQAHADRFAALPSPGRLAADLRHGGAKMAMHAKGGVTHNNNDNSRVNDVRFNSLNIHTAATDARGIAHGIGQALQNHMTASMAENSLV